MQSIGFPKYIDTSANISRAFETAVTKQLPTIILGSLALIVTLNWNDTISALFNHYLPKNLLGLNYALTQLIHSLILSIIAFLIAYVIIKTTSYTFT